MLSLLFILSNFQIALGISPVSALVSHLCAVVQEAKAKATHFSVLFLETGMDFLSVLGQTK